MGRVRLCAWALAMVCAAAPGLAAEYDVTRLFAKGEWSVDLTYNTAENITWCAADTENRAGQWFSIVAYDEGGAAVFLGDPQWQLSPRDIRLRLDIDYSRWDIDAEAAEESVVFFLSGAEAAPDFLVELMRGSAISAFNDDGDQLAEFSLTGSHAAMTELIECWQRIDRRDPFAESSDPF